MPPIRLELQLRGHAKHELLRELLNKQPEEGTGQYWYGFDEFTELPNGVKITFTGSKIYEADIGSPMYFAIDNLKEIGIALLSAFLYDLLKKHSKDLVGIKIGKDATRLDKDDIAKMLCEELERLEKDGGNNQ